jgi:hypothetical protein
VTTDDKAATAEAPEGAPAHKSGRTEAPSGLELATAILLSAATLASAWGAYQATRWGGVQTLSLGHANTFRAESVRASNRALQQSQIDVTAFVAWLQARARGDSTEASVLRARFRREFVPAFEAWLASASTPAAVPPGTPFQQPEYQLASQREADSLAEKSAAAFAETERVNQIGDNFVFAVVLFTSSVFFAGIQTKMSSSGIRLALLGAAFVLFLVAGVFLLRLPQNFGL